MSDDTQIAKMGQSLPKINQPQQPIQANLNQYGNESRLRMFNIMMLQRIRLCSLCRELNQPAGLSLDKVSHSTMTVLISLSLELSNMTEQHSWFQRIEP